MLKFGDSRRQTVGNDTGSCDSFGSDKRKEYNAIPTIGQFAISFVQKGKDNKENTVVAAQSIVTFDRDIGKYVIKEMKDEKNYSIRNNLIKKLGEDFLERFYEKKPVLSCDNIEKNKAMENKLFLFDGKTLGDIYREYFQEVISQNPWLDQKRFIVGSRYNDASIKRDLGGNKISNNFSFSPVISYSDRIENFCFEVETGLAKKEDEKTRENGVFDLSPLDSLPVAFLEEKIYREEEGVEQIVNGLFEDQNILMAGKYCEAKYNTPNLNLGYFDEKGVLRGYCLAYPAKEEHGDVCILVENLGGSGEHRAKAGSRILFNLLERIKEAREKLKEETGQEKVRIYMSAREDTSLPLVRKMAERYGLLIREEEESEEGFVKVILE